MTSGPTASAARKRIEGLRTLRHLIAIAALWSLALPTCAAESAGTIKTLIGSAQVDRAGAMLPAAPGQRLFTGDRVFAAEASYVGITLHDDTRLTIGPGSGLLIREFEFNPSSYVGKLAVVFLKGTARILTGIIASHRPDQVSFHTRTMAIGIRGTDFIVDLEGDE